MPYRWLRILGHRFKKGLLMSHYDDDMGRQFDERATRIDRSEEWKTKGLKFLRYLSTRQMEVWGFFAAGFILSKIF